MRIVIGSWARSNSILIIIFIIVVIFSLSRIETPSVNCGCLRLRRKPHCILILNAFIPRNLGNKYTAWLVLIYREYVDFFRIVVARPRTAIRLILLRSGLGCNGGCCLRLLSGLMPSRSLLSCANWFDYFIISRAYSIIL